MKDVNKLVLDLRPILNQLKRCASKQRLLASGRAHMPCDEEVVGSNPAKWMSIFFFFFLLFCFILALISRAFLKDFSRRYVCLYL